MILRFLHIRQVFSAPGPHVTSRRRRAKYLLLAFGFLACLSVAVGRTGAAHLATLSDDLLLWQANPWSATIRVIVAGTRSELEALLVRHPLPVVRWLADSVVLSVNSDELLDLASDPNVPHLSGDVMVVASMAIENESTGANQVRQGRPGSLLAPPIPGLTGAGIGVAVIDSGISPHVALNGKVVANVSFVRGDTRTDDPFGHGTHVAGIIAAVPVAAAGSIPAFPGGIAPGARLINVRVLSADGRGYTSDVIAGIDWAIAHRTDYNIRVINLSVGHPVVEPAITDPLCQAVARAVAHGIVVVASAGNDGRTVSGLPVLGGIGSPGNSPFALTVAALNSWLTAARDDDTVAEYSSRGPSRFDFSVKPDLAAPGTHVLSLEAAGSYLPAAYPSIHISGSGTNAYMRLSGTSMATPMVSGAAALLLQGTPQLGPSHIKLALQAGASFVPRGGLVGGGAGSMNIWASRSITGNGLSQLLTGGDLVQGASGALFWDGGSLAAGIYGGVGVHVLSPLDVSRIWNDPSTLQFGSLNLTGLLNPLKLIPPIRLLWGSDVANWTGADRQIIWGTTLYDTEGKQVVWGSSDDQIIWGTNGDQIIWGTNGEPYAPPQ